MPRGIPGKPIINCPGCGCEKEHYAKGFCESCCNRQWHKENRPRHTANKRRHYRENPERIKTRNRRWKQANPEKARVATRRWLEENAERVRFLGRRWRKENPGKVAANASRRRARKRNLPSTLTGEQAERKLSSLPCFYCGTTTDLTLDHFVPLGVTMNKGCGTTLANTVVACKSCNPSKGTKMPSELLGQLALV